MRKLLLCSAAALMLLATPALAGWEWGGRDRGDRGGAGGRQTEREAYEQLRRDFPGQSTHSREKSGGVGDKTGHSSQMQDKSIR